MHHVGLLDAGVLSELASDSGDEAWFVLTCSKELPVQSQDLLLQLTVPRHGQHKRLYFKNRAAAGGTWVSVQISCVLRSVSVQLYDYTMKPEGNTREKLELQN